MGCFLFVRIFFDIPDIFFQRCSVFWFAINPKSPFLEQTLSRSFYWDWSFGPFAMNGPFFLSLHWWIPHLLWLDPNTTMAWFYGTGWFWPFGSQHHFIVERCWNYSMTSWWYIYIFFTWFLILFGYPLLNIQKTMEHHHDINQRTFYGHFQWQTVSHYQKVFPQSTIELRKLTP